MLNRIMIYTKRMENMVDFYTAFFGFSVIRDPDDRLVTLRPIGDGVEILLHPAAKSQRDGQVMVKLVFDCQDVAVRKSELEAAGLHVGPVLDAGEYKFANLKDPSGNSIQISERGYRSV